MFLKKTLFENYRHNIVHGSIHELVSACEYPLKLTHRSAGEVQTSIYDEWYEAATREDRDLNISQG